MSEVMTYSIMSLPPARSTPPYPPDPHSLSSSPDPISTRLAAAHTTFGLPVSVGSGQLAGNIRLTNPHLDTSPVPVNLKRPYAPNFNRQPYHSSPGGFSPATSGMGASPGSERMPSGGEVSRRTSDERTYTARSGRISGEASGHR